MEPMAKREAAAALLQAADRERDISRRALSRPGTQMGVRIIQCGRATGIWERGQG
jgi:hypothetical protein